MSEHQPQETQKGPGFDCPRCWKPMVEEAKFPGLWRCPDYRTPINDRPPYQFKCTGMHLTQEGCRDFERECFKQMTQLN